jgi:hypothetical protein
MNPTIGEADATSVSSSTFQGFNFDTRANIISHNEKDLNSFEHQQNIRFPEKTLAISRELLWRSDSSR